MLVDVEVFRVMRIVGPPGLLQYLVPPPHTFTQLLW